MQPTTHAPWSLWPTLALAVSLLIVISLIEVLGGLAFVAITKQQDFEALATNGDFLSIMLTIRTLLGVGLIALFCHLRQPLTLREYLALRQVSWRVALLWLVILFAFLGLSEWLYHLLQRDPHASFMKLAYANTTFLPWLWLTIILIAPLFEEIFFRGFLFAGLQHSRLGNTGAILITALLFAIIHLQYDWPEMIVVFVLGLLLAIARWRSGSVLLPFILHATNNFAATLQLALSQGA